MFKEFLDEDHPIIGMLNAEPPLDADYFLNTFKRQPRDNLINILLQAANLKSGVDLSPLVEKAKVKYEQKASAEPTKSIINKLKSMRQESERKREAQLLAEVEAVIQQAEGKEAIENADMQEAMAEAYASEMKEADILAGLRAAEVEEAERAMDVVEAEEAERQSEELRPAVLDFLLQPGEIIDLEAHAETPNGVLTRGTKGKILSVGTPSAPFSVINVALAINPGFEFLPSIIELKQTSVQDVWVYTVEGAPYWIDFDLRKRR